MSAVRIRAFHLACANVEATMDFYRSTFGCRAAADGAAGALLLGRERLEFAAAMRDEGPPPPSNATGFQHCAIVVSDMAAAMEALASAPGWSAVSLNGPERLPAASGGVTAFKFRDPEGHPLELLRFPEGRAPEPWASIAGGPFLGIDHSAVTVADAVRSIAFYAARGFRLAERHLNRGVEQGRLDGLGGEPSVEVATLIPEGGAPPHLELLCYRTPATLVRPAADGSRFATVSCLAAAAPAAAGIVDPDGHRLAGAPETGDQRSLASRSAS